MSEDTIYTAKLRRRGIDVSGAQQINPMTTLMVRDAMQPVRHTLTRSLPVQEAVDQMARDGHEALAVVDEKGQYREVITARGLEQALEGGDVDAAVGPLMKDVPTLAADQNLEEAVRALSWTDGAGLPVSDDRRRAADRVVDPSRCTADVQPLPRSAVRNAARPSEGKRIRKRVADR